MAYSLAIIHHKLEKAVMHLRWKNIPGHRIQRPNFPSHPSHQFVKTNAVEGAQPSEDC